MKQETKRLYQIADADLKQLADDLRDSIVRDATDFATRNVGPAKLTAFDALITDFDNVPTDVELRGLVTQATEAKDQIVEKVHIAVRTIRGMADQAFKNSGKYKVFGFADMTLLSDSKLVQLAKRVVRVATTAQAELTEKGLQPAHLTSLSTLATALDMAIDAVRGTEENRDMQTQERIEKGNRLYTQLIDLAAVGKNLFEDTDEARFNDYVVIGSKVAPGTNEVPTP